MIRFVSVMIIVLGLSQWGRAENNMMFEKANQLYHNKEYKQAIDLYNQMLTDGYTDDALYYNLGNAYYKTKQMGLSIWCYKKAIQCRNKKSYRDNLLMAQKQVLKPGDANQDIFFIRWWKAILHLLSPNAWACMSLFLFLIGLSYLFYNKVKGIKASRSILATLCFIISGCSMILTMMNYYQKTSAIVVMSNVAFSPNTKTPPVILSEGMEICIEKKGAMQLLVTLPDGRVGSIPKKAVREL